MIEKGEHHICTANVCLTVATLFKTWRSKIDCPLEAGFCSACFDPIIVSTMNDGQQKEIVALVSWLETFPSFGFQIVKDDGKHSDEAVKNAMEYLDRMDTTR